MPIPVDAQPGRPLRILVIRLGSMGDIIHAMPAVTLLRRMLPTANIDWVIEERWRELLCADSPRRLNADSAQWVNKIAPTGHPKSAAELSKEVKPLVNVVHKVDTLRWRKNLLSSSTWYEIKDVVSKIRDTKYDIAVDFQGAWKSAVISKLSGAPVRVGFRRPRETGTTMLYNRQHIDTETHVIEQNTGMAWAVVEAANGAANSGAGQDARRLRSLPAQDHRPERRRPCDSPRVPFPSHPQIEEWCEQELKRHHLRGSDFILINPGAGWGAKCWPVERYAEVAVSLEEQGLKTIVNFGPSEENLARQMERLSGGAAIPIGCSISQLVTLTRRTRLFLGGDTGPLHLAAALGVPVVAIFGPTDPARNGPYGTANIVLRSPESRTSHARVAATEEGLLSITPPDVLNAIWQLISVSSPGFERQSQTVEIADDSESMVGVGLAGKFSPPGGLSG